jgi:hypothetical protein
MIRSRALPAVGKGRDGERFVSHLIALQGRHACFNGITFSSSN